jgi:hypothetical protein
MKPKHWIRIAATLALVTGCYYTSVLEAIVPVAKSAEKIGGPKKL